MTQFNQVLVVGSLTMSSVEIAELMGKQHAHVMRDIKKMFDELNLDVSRFGGIYLDSYQRENPVFNLPKRECLILVSGYNVQLRAKIIDRWQALEAQQPAFEIPQTLPDALMLAAQLAQEAGRLEAELKAAEPKLVALDKIAVAKDSLCLQETAKALQMRPADLIAWLQAHEWIYKRAGAAQWLGYQAKVQTGLLEHKVTTVSRSDGSEKVVTQVRVTAKGLTRLGSVCVA